MTANWSLAERIRDHWSDRASTFDDHPGHRITEGLEMSAWQALLGHALGGSDLAGIHLLDLACGTGEMSRVALDMGARVTAIDFAEPMLERARAKHHGRNWSGILADAQVLAGLPANAFDAAMARHLAWTLTDPAAAFATWARVLRPGGRLIVVDGDWVSVTVRGRVLRALADRLEPKDRGPDAEQHEKILAELPYCAGLRADVLQRDLEEAGFTSIRRLPIHRVYLLGLRRLPAADWLRLNAPSRFALVAEVG